MANYTYFVITPGVTIRSCIVYPDGVRGNFIKFGDSESDHGSLGIRSAYVTHNPDIGVAAVMKSSTFQNPSLGTILKKFIRDDLGYPAVGNTEWFGFIDTAAWPLFDTMLNRWDGKTIDQNNIENLKNDIRRLLQAENKAITLNIPELEDLNRCSQPQNT